MTNKNSKSLRKRKSLFRNTEQKTSTWLARNNFQTICLQKLTPLLLLDTSKTHIIMWVLFVSLHSKIQP